ncbi:uncharacterized protein LOC129766644 [Toxorhynchites rutilus septentrionalis]|uniref:uncharacterized protein LOC129766644 n=1 Tax=Toxorhynchites rutilus septentrionalis TaxID=329112 RepID=UPI002478F97F|nr:uncharacterized protein LOC129766644 [Toxorhynchites rutilus septentrionalis]
MVTGLDDLDELIELKEEITAILIDAGFKLHKWNSNSSALVPDDRKKDEVKILGLRWNSKVDVFGFQSELQMHTKITKRNVLSDIQKIYDPLGMLSPLVVHGKLIMQDIWSQKLDWDEPLPEAIADKWRWFCVQISEIHNIVFPRRITTSEPSHKNIIELHGFSDAAKRAYGAAIYVRTITENGAQIQLLCAKSRVTPTSEKNTDENTTIPRMELRAASLLVHLMEKVKATVHVKIDWVYYWTDSTVTLDWIASPTKRRPQFITNRVNEINARTSIKDWYHVSSGENPADPISRGSSVKLLAKNSLWWSGPDFLLNCNQLWSHSEVEQIDCFITRNTERISEPDDIASPIRDYTLLERYSSIGKLQRVVAYCLRFKKNCFSRDNRKIGSLAMNELKDALKHIIKISQKKKFTSEIQQLTTNKKLSNSSSLLTLRPFLDQDGLLRVGGRIQAAGLDYDQLHPIILPANCKLTFLIAVDKHISHLHIGPQSLLYTIRLNYWPIHGKNLVRKVVHRCLTCFRNNPQSLKQVMGEIPKVRLTPGRPFQTCGVDFGGPFTIKENFIRTQKTLKVYVALFICLRTRAVHIELVSSLSSPAFIAALRRFSSQRGQGSTIFCDNATNFVGSKNEIQRLTEQFKNQIEPEVRKFCAVEEIEWKFIPPRSPNFGGIWEAGIKSVKHHMKRVLGSTIPTYEEMLTLLKQIEGCLNSRPISPLSTDARDPNPLTPGHFLVGGPITAIPDKLFCETSSTRLTRYEEVQKNLQLFWNRWRVEYLNNLQQRTKKWSSKQPDLLLGQLCLVKDDALPANTWITGRVIKLHPGPDKHIRVATLITAKGEIKRSISKLCPLPIEEDVGGGGVC